MDWRDRLTGGQAAPPPPGNGAHDPRARSGHRGDLVDLSPLPEPVNVFGFTAGMLRGHPAPTTAKERELWEQQIGWLEHCAQLIPYESANPVVCLAMGRAACIADERVRMAAALEGLDAVIGAAYDQGAQQGG